MQLRSVTVGIVAALQFACASGTQRVELSSGVDELEARASADSNDALAHYEVALAYWNQQRFDAAERLLRESINIDPQLPEAYLALAYLPLASDPGFWTELLAGRLTPDRQRRLREATRDYRRAVLLNPFLDLRLTGSAPPPERPDTSALPDWYDSWRDSHTHLRRGNYKETYVQLGRVIEKLQKERDKGGETDHTDRRGIASNLLWHRGLAAAHVGSYEEAASDFQALIDRPRASDPAGSVLPFAPTSADLRFLMARMAQEAGQIERAVDLYRAAVAEDAGLYMAHTHLARIYELSGRWDEAIEECQRSIAANPSESTLFLHLGVTLGKANRFDPAADALRRAIQLNPRDTRAFYLLGLVELERNDPQAAKDAFNRFLQLAPSRLATERADAKRRLESLR